jgi:hypothetical protein
VRDCKHGHLARSCEVCERESRIEELEAGIAAFRQVAEDEVGTYECLCIRGGSTMDTADRNKLEAAEEALYALIDGST